MNEPITATPVPDTQRMQFLPKHIGVGNLMREQYLFQAYLEKLSVDYNGGYWEFFELSNGGWYLAPRTDARFRMSWDGNGYEGTMSADAAGITACMFAIGQLANTHQTDELIHAYHNLRAFAVEHAEAADILAAID